MFLTSVIATFLSALTVNTGTIQKTDSNGFASVVASRTGSQLESGFRLYYSGSDEGLSYSSMVFSLNISGSGTSNRRIYYGYSGLPSNVSYTFSLENVTRDWVYQSKYVNQYTSNVGEYSDTLDIYLDTDSFYIYINFYLLSENDYSYYEGEKSYSTGYQDGYDNGFSVGNSEGQSAGYNEGYADAREEYEDQSGTVNSIFNGILSIGLIPVEFFMSIFNFSILGINVTSIISAILSLMIIVILLRIVLGGKSGKE